jgi:hypothetical protein
VRKPTRQRSFDFIAFVFCIFTFSLLAGLSNLKNLRGGQRKQGFIDGLGRPSSEQKIIPIAHDHLVA